ncbi:hypothetical protein I302_106907 [Kwoniella bestiolae CBS 10118]|uniref:Uncharacterized protein n=1 Tax=Kwoniella bestiolae CBS 10118 TaxID=1296100 RepID=A0A1B9G020_9TREE|nr:hypothetical protein I302_05827 [Kwoniella bestiolae CBS 10118]OCF24367.1 hypothetical protein I302_05827 [Kwoniella bestiolae CBS 10118]
MAVAPISTERDITFYGNTVNTHVKISLDRPTSRTSIAATKTDREQSMTSLIKGCDILTHALVAKWRKAINRNPLHERANESLREEWQAHMDRAFDTVIDHSGKETGVKLCRPLVESQKSSQPSQRQAAQSLCREWRFSSWDLPRYDKASLQELRDEVTRQDQSLGLALRFSKEALETAFSELDKYGSNRALLITYPACPGEYIEDISGLKFGFVKNPRKGGEEEEFDCVDNQYMTAVVDAAKTAMEMVRLWRNYQRTLNDSNGKDDEHETLHKKTDLKQICRALRSEDGQAFDDSLELSYSIRPIDVESSRASSSEALNWDDEYDRVPWDEVSPVEGVVPDIIDSSNIHSLLRTMAEAEGLYATLRTFTYKDGFTVSNFIDWLGGQDADDWDRSPEWDRRAAIFLCKDILKARDPIQPMTDSLISQISRLKLEP